MKANLQISGTRLFIKIDEQKHSQPSFVKKSKNIFNTKKSDTQKPNNVNFSYGPDQKLIISQENSKAYNGKQSKIEQKKPFLNQPIHEWPSWATEDKDKQAKQVGRTQQTQWQTSSIATTDTSKDQQQPNQNPGTGDGGSNHNNGKSKQLTPNQEKTKKQRRGVVQVDRIPIPHLRSRFMLIKYFYYKSQKKNLTYFFPSVSDCDLRYKEITKQQLQNKNFKNNYRSLFDCNFKEPVYAVETSKAMAQLDHYQAIGRYQHKLRLGIHLHKNNDIVIM